MSDSTGDAVDRAVARVRSLDETMVPDNTKETQIVETPSDDTPKSKPAGRTQPDAKSGKKSSGKNGKKVTQLGDFKLVKKLGQGGMGTVYLAKQVSLDRKIALKTLSKELAKKQTAVDRFLREARSMAKLTHPNIVQVFAADSMHGYHFAALEFIDGQSMQDWMDDKKQLSVGDALHVILVCADALDHAHHRNMIHRDVKPDNILVTNDGVVKVSDFGLAKAIDEDVSITQSGTGLGTPLYMSPEQARDAKRVDHRSDIYALGVTLYYFLTGDLPFKGSTTLEVIMAKEQGKFPPVRKQNAEVPERLDLIIDKMMSKNIEHRYADVASLINDLEALGLANDALSFIDSPQAANTRSRTRSPSQRTIGTTSSKTQAATLPPAASEQRKEDKLWYVSYKGNDGKHHTKQMAEPEIVRWLKAGMLTTEAKARRKKTEPQLPLAQFPEFVQYVEKAALRERHKTKSTGDKLKDLYAEHDRYEKKKRLHRFFRRITDSALGGFGVVLFFAAIAGVCVGLYYGIPWVGKMIADYFGLSK